MARVEEAINVLGLKERCTMFSKYITTSFRDEKGPHLIN